MARKKRKEKCCPTRDPIILNGHFTWASKGQKIEGLNVREYIKCCLAECGITQDCETGVCSIDLTNADASTLDTSDLDLTIDLQDNDDGTFNVTFNGVATPLALDVCKLITDGQCELFTLNGDIISAGDDIILPTPPEYTLLDNTDGTFSLLVDGVEVPVPLNVCNMITAGRCDLFEINGPNNGTTVQVGDVIEVISPNGTISINWDNLILELEANSDFYTDDPTNPTQQIHTAVDGTETCVPKCVSYLAGPQGDRIFTSDCKFMHTDLATGDNPCVVAGTTFPGLSVWKLKANSLDPNTIVHLSADGVLTYELLDCDNPSITSFDYCIQCPDGTTFTNTVDVIYTPPPIGEIRLDKDFTPNTVEIGDTVELQLTACNSGTGSITGISVTDVLPTGLVFAGTGGFPITGTLDATTVPGTVTWTPGVSLAPDECISQSFFVDVTTTDIYFDNFANAVADDGNGGITQDYDSDTLTQEPSPAVSITHDITGGPDNIVTNIVFEKDAGTTPADINDCITINKTINGNTFTYSGQWGTDIPSSFLEQCGVFGGTQTWSPTGEWILEGWVKNVNPTTLLIDPNLAHPIEWEAIIDRNCTGNTATDTDDICYFESLTFDNNTILGAATNPNPGTFGTPPLGGMTELYPAGVSPATFNGDGLIGSSGGRWFVGLIGDSGEIYAYEDCNGNLVNSTNPLTYGPGNATLAGGWFVQVAEFFNQELGLESPWTTRQFNDTINTWWETAALNALGQAQYDEVFDRISFLTSCASECSPTKLYVRSLTNSSIYFVIDIMKPSFLKR